MSQSTGREAGKGVGEWGNGGQKFKNKVVDGLGFRGTSQRLSLITEAPQNISFLSCDPQTHALLTSGGQLSVKRTVHWNADTGSGRPYP